MTFCSSWYYNHGVVKKIVSSATSKFFVIFFTEYIEK